MTKFNINDSLDEHLQDDEFRAKFINAAFKEDYDIFMLCVDDVIRANRKRKDNEFKRQLKRLVEQDKELMDKLAKR
jgi:hypothetical protein